MSSLARQVSGVRRISTRQLAFSGIAIAGLAAASGVAAGAARASVNYYPLTCTTPAQTKYAPSALQGSIYNDVLAGVGCNGGTGYADPCGQFLYSLEGHEDRSPGPINCGNSSGGGWHYSELTIGTSLLTEFSSAFPGARVCEVCHVDAYHPHYLAGWRHGGVHN